LNPDYIYREHRDDALALQATASEYSTFVAMPFTENNTYQSKAVFHDLICAAAARANEIRGKDLRPFKTPSRVDNEPSAALVVTDEIVIGILRSHFVIADLTTSNVGAVLEAGVAIGLKSTRQIIFIFNEDFTNLHFDIRNNHIIKYESSRDPIAIGKIAGALLAAAQSFENDRERHIDFVKSSLSPDAIQWLRVYANLWQQNPKNRPSLHRNILTQLDNGRFQNDATAHMIFTNGTHELLMKRLMKTEYNVCLQDGNDYFGMQATDLGRAVIQQMWNVVIPRL
jgi:hypothetical protein